MTWFRGALLLAVGVFVSAGTHGGGDRAFCVLVLGVVLLGGILSIKEAT